jgi:hypothetical protein
VPDAQSTHDLGTDSSCGGGFTTASRSALALGPMQDNGGRTPTIALLPTSVALDAGDTAACAGTPVTGLDQRQVARPQGPGCDVGAFERRPPTLAFVGGASCAAGTQAGATVAVAVAADGGDSTDVTVTATSSNGTLVPAGGLTTGGSGAARTLAVAPAAGRSGAADLTVRAGDGHAAVTAHVRLRVGTAHADTLAGSDAVDVLLGLGGGDTLKGAANVDVLCGGDGADRLAGGPGDDALGGGAGGDRLTGGSGADAFSGGPGTDRAVDLRPAEGDTSDGTLP